MIGLITKAILSAFVSAGSAVIAALQDGHIEVLEWITISSAFLVSLGAVWAVPNLPDGIKRYLKAIVAALLAGLSALFTALFGDGGISADEWVVIVLALITGSGLVYVAPDAPASTNIPPRDGQGVL